MTSLLQVWACYSVFDQSYANRQSFGFFIDVGNGYSTIIPTLLFLLGMTCHGEGGYQLPFTAQQVGIVGLLSFYQEFYGTVVYFLSFFMNKR
jgi:hypothetical protein